MSRIHAPRRERTSSLAIGRLRRSGGRSRGQSLVEFAVVLPVFLLILAAVIDFGMGLYSQMTVINAAREGARVGVVESDQANVETAVRDRVSAMSAGLDASRLSITVTCKAAGGGACSAPKYGTGDTVVVRVDYDYRMLWPLALGNSIDLSSTVQMRRE